MSLITEEGVDYDTATRLVRRSLHHPATATYEGMCRPLRGHGWDHCQGYAHVFSWRNTYYVVWRERDSRKRIRFTKFSRDFFFSHWRLHGGDLEVLADAWEAIRLLSLE